MGQSAIPAQDRRLLWLGGFLLVVAFTGGSARADVPGLLVLRPLAVLTAGWALWRLSAAERGAGRKLWVLAGLTLLLPALQLVPLPPGWRAALPHGALLAEAEAVLGLAPRWRPLSLDPALTRNALWSLAVPLAVLALALPLDRARQERALALVLTLGALSAVLGLLQSVAIAALGPGHRLYLYAITNETSAVGLFANRNHQAATLAAMLPLLAAHVALGGAQRGRRRFVALGMALLLILPALLLSGSRSGLVLGLAGLAAAASVATGRPQMPLLRRNAGVRRPRPGAAWAAGAALLAALVATALFGLEEGRALDRLAGSGSIEEKRWDIWAVSLQMALDGLPTGGGFGTFAGLFQLYEPAEMLGPRYVNHVHNDWLESIVDGGIPAALLLAAWLLVLGRRMVAAFCTACGAEAVLARSACGVLLIAMLASLTDYPLRTPLFAALAALAIVWLWQAGGTSGSARSQPEQTPARALPEGEDKGSETGPASLLAAQADCLSQRQARGITQVSAARA